MNIYGWQKVTLQDFPGRVSTILFTKGCNFKCGYCHNPDLISSEPKDLIPNENIFEFLEKRKKMLDGVVITGGEPVLQKDLFEFIKKVKSLGYDIKLDTNGTRPDLVEKLIEENLVDYFAMDYKYPVDELNKIVNVNLNVELIKKSRDLLINKSKDYEFRITVVEELFTDKIIKQIAEELKDAKVIYLQPFSNENVFDEKYYNYSKTTADFLNSMKEKMAGCNVVIRSI